MTRIDSDSKYGDVLKCSEFAFHRDSICLMQGIPGFLTHSKRIRELSEMAGNVWNPDSIAGGFSHLADTIGRGESFFKLWSENEIAKDRSKATAELIAFPLKKKSPFVIICPGGAYMSVASAIEGFPTAKRLNELGYAAFVLKYRALKHARAPNPVDDLAQAIRFIIGNAEKFNILPESYGVMGFSAGGHLAACFGTERLGYARYGLPKPGCMILAYPVITMGKHTHRLSQSNFLGRKGASNPELTERWSVEKQATENYPPTFIWQCDRDSAVPIDNSRLMVHALETRHVQVRYETFNSDVHGWGSAEGTAAEGWIDRSVAFMEMQRTIDKGE